jgi:GntR family transcriptional regulator/MocR family aminotransferase
MQLFEAATLDRKSGEAKGSAVRHSGAPHFPFNNHFPFVLPKGASSYASAGPRKIAKKVVPRMTGRPAPYTLLLPPREAGTSAFRWLYAALRADILAGRLRPGSRLPATRDLAAQYSLSRGTVVSAFEELKSEGYLHGSAGSGTYVSTVLPEHLLQVASEAAQKTSARKPRPRRLSDYGVRVRAFSNLESRPTRAFRANLPALDLFPTKIWTRLAERRLRRLSMPQLLGCDTMGYLPLRTAVADYLNRSRGTQCEPEQVMIVSGTQEALDLAGRLILNPGDQVCVEEPGYPGAAMAFEALGAKICPVPVDSEGMELPGPRARKAKLVYVTPGHQFPACTTMSLARRLQLLEWARRSCAFIFEDDYDSEFRYVGRPIPALQGLDRQGSVIFSGSFSKVLFPSLRLGYLVLPPDLVEQFAAAKSILNRHAPPFEQTVLCDFIVEGHFGRHLRRMREVYAERLSALMESAGRRLEGLLELSTVEAGLQTVGWLPPGIDSEEARQAAEVRKVEVTPLRVYTRGPVQREGLQMGFAAVNPQEIRRGVHQLALALEELARPHL